MAKFFHHNERCWVDLFTNEAFVTNPQTASLTDILMSQNFPKEIFFCFVHEATHFWSFDSYLGNALFMIKLRAFLSSLTFTDENPLYREPTSGLLFESEERRNLKYDIYSDFTRFYTVATVLKPLGEGMALFAELDTYPTPSEVCPSFLIYCSIMFSGFRRTEFLNQNLKEIEKKYLNLLIERRFQSRVGLLTKARLLSTAIDIFESPYLTGYLFVKCTQIVLSRQDERFKDPNFFLTFLKDYYFNDKGFIEMLLSNDVRDETIVTRVFDYFQHHSSALLSVNSDDIDAFEKRFTQDYKNISFANAPKPEALANFPAFQALLDQFDANCQKYDLIGLAFMRTFFRATILPCYIDVSEKHVDIFLRLNLSEMQEERIGELLKMPKSFCDGQYLYYPSVTFANADQCKDYKGEATLEKYISFRDITKHFSVFLYDAESVFFPFGDSHCTADEIELITSYFRNSKIKFKDLDFDAIIKTVWDSNDPLITSIEEFHRTNNFHILNTIYQLRAFNCSQSTFENINSLLRGNGFCDLLGKSRLVEILAFLSLYSSNKCISKELLKQNEIFSNYSEEDIKKLEESLEQSGFSLLKTDKNTICTNCI